MRTVLAFATWLLLVPFAGSQPSLEIESLPDSRVRLSWPESAADFGLEQSASLGGTARWQLSSVTPTPAGHRFVVTIAAADHAVFFRLHSGASAPTWVTVASSSPAEGENGVAVTRETILRLSGPLSDSAVITGARLFAEFGGRRLLARPELSSDRRTLTLFYLENLPANGRVGVTFDGSGLEDERGRSIDADADGQPGGRRTLEFETVGNSGLPTTGVEGHVFASEKNPDGSDQPLANVMISVDGAEETLRTITDLTGAFRLQPAPAGRFFVHIDGRTAAGSQWPNGAYYPFVGKGWDAIAGKSNNLANGTGTIFLPLIPGDALKAVSATEETKITFSPSEIAGNPALSGVEVDIPPNVLLSENGARGGKVGIAAVPPDRLPEPLPPGLNLPIVITIQTDGPQNFDRPVPVRFPNLPDPVTGEKLPPGAKTVLWSFNHDTGRWEAQGTATITADGNFAVTDPGVGVRQPGWHGTAPGSPTYGPPRKPLPSECQGDDCPPCVQTVICTVINKPGEHYAICALKCLGNVVDEIFGNGPKPERTAFETGLRCIGGPDTCPQNPDDTLSKERRDCMDKCRFPDTGKRVYVVPCEGFTYPCEENPSLRSLHDNRAALQATQDLIPDRFEEQSRFWEVEGEFLVRLTGTPKIIENSSADVPKVNALFDALAHRVRSGTPSGIHLSEQERDELIALPRPGQFSLAEWTAMIDRLDSLQGNPVPADVAAADQALQNLVALLKQRGWKYRLHGLIHGFARLSRERAPEFGSAAFPARAHYYYLKHHESGLVQRGRLSASGQFDNMVLSPNGLYTVVYFDPVTWSAGAAFFQAFNTGSTSVIPTAPFEAFPADEPDSDSDGLPDVLEEILGTNAGSADTDGDGNSDKNEIAQGTNPLDGVPQALGVITGVDTPGSAVDVCVWNDLAVVADSTAGVAFFDVANPLSPVLLAQLDTPGRAISVAGSGTLLAVGDDAEGVMLVDVSNPSTPTPITELRLARQVRAVAIINGQIAAGLASGEVDLLSESGELLDKTTPDNSPVQDVLSLNGILYVYKAGSVEAFKVTGGVLTSGGKVDSPGEVGAAGRMSRLSGAGDRLWVTHRSGYNVFDVSAPLSPKLLLEFNTSQFGWRQIVPDGSGLAMAAVGNNSSDDGPHDVSLYNLGPTGQGTNFVTTFLTPGLAAAVCFHRGVALVADSLSGLSVVNYLPHDAGTVPPAVRVRGRFGQAAPAPESGARFTLVADATDDHLVSHVEFYVNDQRVAMDGNYPFEVDLRAPVLTPAQPQFTVRARAFDTGGNSAWSDVLTVDLTRDLVPPTAITYRPTVTDRFLIGMEVPVSVRFDEPMAAGTLGSQFRLIHLGADETLDTSDDSPVPTSVREIGPAEYALDFTNPLPLGLYLVQLGTNVTDLAGNPMMREVTWQFRVQPLNEFVGAASLNWGGNNAATNNWSTHRIPVIDDWVRVAAREGAEVVVGPFVIANAYDLTASAPMRFEGGSTLRIGQRAVFAGPVDINGAALQGGEVFFQGGIRMSGSMGISDQSWINEGYLTMSNSAGINFRNVNGTRTTLRNLRTGIWEMAGSQMGVGSTASGPVDFVNEGLLIASGTDRNYIGVSRLINLGSVEVRGGMLEIRAGDANNGASQHLGSYRVDAGATLSFTGLSEFGRATRIFGDGNVNFSKAVFPGSYEINGTTSVNGDVTFSGPVRSSGAWNTRGGHAIFTGLNPQITGPVVVEGAMTVAVQPEMRLSNLTTYRDLTISTALEVNGPLRLDSTTTPSGSIAAARLLGTGRLRANGPLTFAGIVNSAGQGTLEIGGVASGLQGTIVQWGSGYGVSVLPGGTLDLSGISRFSPRGIVTNQGALLKSDPTTTLLTTRLRNEGTVKATAGTLVLQNGNIVQTSGSITLAGGAITTGPAPGFSGDFTVVLQGGTLEGAGALTCFSLTNLAEITPGLPVGMLDLQVGDHPVYSVYQQEPAGKLTLDIEGPTPGTGHDQVKVSGRAVLAGILNLRPAATFDPPLGQEFVILTCKLREGTFSEVAGASLPGGKRLDVIYESTLVKLRVVSP